MMVLNSFQNTYRCKVIDGPGVSCLCTKMGICKKKVFLCCFLSCIHSYMNVYDIEKLEAAKKDFIVVIGRYDFVHF